MRLRPSSLLLLIGSAVIASAFPIDPKDSIVQVNTGGAVFLGVAFLVIASIAIAACACCRERNNGFKEFRNSTGSLNQIGFTNALASELAIFPPPGVEPRSPVGRHQEPTSPHHQQAITKPIAFSSPVPDVSSWFDSNGNFPRQQLFYQREIGKGWFGKVVEGEARGSKVVVRILREDATQDEKAYFLHEAKPFRDLRHRNVTKLFGKCLDQHPYLLLFDMHSNGDLKSFLVTNAGSQTAINEQGLSLRMMTDVTEGLNYMIENGFIHTDVAARNCLVTSDLTVKIGDYGASIDLYKDEYYIIENVAVPIRWCAPETLHCTPTTIETKQVTSSANVWSLGVLLWEIAEFGRLPYEDLTDDQVIIRVFGGEKLRLTQPTCPYGNYLHNILQLCWRLTDRASLAQVLSMLHYLRSYPSQSQVDFDTRWNNTKPNTIPVVDNHTPIHSPRHTQLAQRAHLQAKSEFDSGVDLEIRTMTEETCTPATISPQHSVTSEELFQPPTKKSASLTNLQGSLERFDSWLDGEEDRKFAENVSEAIKNLDETLALEKTSSSSSSGSFKKGPDFRLGPIETGSGSDTEDETWRHRIERGEFTEKVKEKSKSVTDLMVLTHIESEGSETDSLPSLTRQYSIKKASGSRITSFTNIGFGSEGNIRNAVLSEELQDKLKQLSLWKTDEQTFLGKVASEVNNKETCVSDVNTRVNKTVDKLISEPDDIGQKHIEDVLSRFDREIGRNTHHSKSVQSPDLQIGSEVESELNTTPHSRKRRNVSSDISSFKSGIVSTDITSGLGSNISSPVDSNLSSQETIVRTPDNISRSTSPLRLSEPLTQESLRQVKVDTELKDTPLSYNPFLPIKVENLNSSSETSELCIDNSSLIERLDKPLDFSRGQAEDTEISIRLNNIPPSEDVSLRERVVIAPALEENFNSDILVFGTDVELSKPEDPQVKHTEDIAKINTVCTPKVNENLDSMISLPEVRKDFTDDSKTEGKDIVYNTLSENVSSKVVVNHLTIENLNSNISSSESGRVGFESLLPVKLPSEDFNSKQDYIKTNIDSNTPNSGNASSHERVVITPAIIKENGYSDILSFDTGKVCADSSLPDLGKLEDSKSEQEPFSENVSLERVVIAPKIKDNLDSKILFSETSSDSLLVNRLGKLEDIECNQEEDIKIDTSPSESISLQERVVQTPTIIEAVNPDVLSLEKVELCAVSAEDLEEVFLPTDDTVLSSPLSNKSSLQETIVQNCMDSPDSEISFSKPSRGSITSLHSNSESNIVRLVDDSQSSSTDLVVEEKTCDNTSVQFDVTPREKDCDPTVIGTGSDISVCDMNLGSLQRKSDLCENGFTCTTPIEDLGNLLSQRLNDCSAELIEPNLKTIQSDPVTALQEKEDSGNSETTSSQESGGGNQVPEIVVTEPVGGLELDTDLETDIVTEHLVSSKPRRFHFVCNESEEDSTDSESDENSSQNESGNSKSDITEVTYVPSKKSSVSISDSVNESSVILGSCEEYTLDYFKGLKTTFDPADNYSDEDYDYIEKPPKDEIEKVGDVEKNSSRSKLDYIDSLRSQLESHLVGGSTINILESPVVDHNDVDLYLDEKEEKKSEFKMNDIISEEVFAKRGCHYDTYFSIDSGHSSDRCSDQDQQMNDLKNRLEDVANSSEDFQLKRSEEEYGGKLQTPDDERSSDSGFRDKGSLSESVEDTCDEKYNLEDIEAELEEFGNKQDYEGGREGWFLHPRENSGWMSVSTEDEEKPSLRLDDEFVNAIRNELQEKLPCAQLGQRQEETDSSPEQERSDAVPLFNYPAILSPILEEQESGQSSLVVEEDSPVLRLEPPSGPSHDTFREDIIKALQYTPTPRKDALIVEDLEYGREEAVYNSETDHVDDVLVVDTETNQATIIESPKPKTQLAFVAPRKLDENFRTEESDSETYDLSSDPLTPDITPYGSDTVSSPENGILSGFFLSPCSVRSDLFDSGPPSLPFDLGQSIDEVEDILDKPDEEAPRHDLVDVSLLIKENLLPNFRDRNDPYPEMLESLSSSDTLSAFQMDDPAEITPSETSKTESTVEERPTTLDVKSKCTPLETPDEETPKCEETDSIFDFEAKPSFPEVENKFEDKTPVIEPQVKIKIFGSDEVESLLTAETKDSPSCDLKETSSKFLESEATHSSSYQWQESNPLDSLDDTSLESELYEARTTFDEFLLPNRSEAGGDPTKPEELMELDLSSKTHNVTVARQDSGGSEIPEDDTPLIAAREETEEKLDYSNDFVAPPPVKSEASVSTEFEEMAESVEKERCSESTEGWLKELLRSQEDEVKEGHSSTALDTKDWPSVDELIPHASPKQPLKPAKQGITSTLALISPDLSVSTDSSKSHSLLSSFSSTPTCDEDGKLGSLSLTLGQTLPGAPLPSPEDTDKGVWRPTIGQLLELTEQVSGTEEMTTSFIEPDPSLYSTPDWESDTSDEHSSSSSGEFIWKPQESLTMERIEEEDEKEEDEEGSEDGSGSEGSGTEFIPSTWDSTATPTKSAIKSSASLSRLDKKRVMFKKEKYQCVYEYPREASDEEEDEPEPWQTPTSPNFTYAMLEDWELGDSEVPASADNDSDSEESKNPKKQDYDFYRLDYNIGSHFMADEGEFFISSCNESSRSEFFPGGCVDGEFAPLASDLTSLGELRHTKDQLRLELPSIRPDKGEASILDSGIDTSSA